MRARGLLSALVALLVLSVSVSSAACDLSCAFSALSSHCDATNRPLEQMDMSRPMQMDGMDETHQPVQSELGPMEIPAVRALSHVTSCRHQHCDRSAITTVQKITTQAPRLAPAVVAGTENSFPNNIHETALHSPGIHLTINLSALDPLSTSLRI